MDDKANILVVDDGEENRVILQAILSDKYNVTTAGDGTEAIELMLRTPKKPCLVLLDVMMPEMDGFQVIQYMKSTPSLSEIPIILITAASDAEVKGLALGAVDYFSKPFQNEIIRLRVAHQVKLVRYRKNMEEMVNRKTVELLDTKQQFLDTMAQLIEHRSMESGGHVHRTRELARILLEGLIKHGMYGDDAAKIDQDLFFRAVPLHDIGKISVPDNILLKPAKLTAEEFETMKLHTTTGSDVIRSMMVAANDNYLQYCYEICRHHHERWDGNGYPDKISGHDIPLTARIVSVIDVYDALVSERCYKKAISHNKAINIIKQGAGTQFDPLIVEALLLEQAKFKKLRKR
jgi:putative two-component system response regulator